jgi:hypothetical protein
MHPNPHITLKRHLYSSVCDMQLCSCYISLLLPPVCSDSNLVPHNSPLQQKAYAIVYCRPVWECWRRGRGRGRWGQRRGCGQAKAAEPVPHLLGCHLSVECQQVSCVVVSYGHDGARQAIFSITLSSNLTGRQTCVPHPHHAPLRNGLMPASSFIWRVICSHLPLSTSALHVILLRLHRDMVVD